jgi:hypothetical protein
MDIYKICWGKTLTELSIMVNSAMSFGWHPVGGVSFDNERYLQAMIKQ